jgi:putative DNA primase/helicase
MTRGPSCAEVAAMLAERMPELTRDLLGEPSQRGRETWRYGRRGSLAVEIAGARRGAWYDHEAGEGGDALALVAHLHRSTMGAARRWALAWLGRPDAAEDRPARRALQRPSRAAPEPLPEPNARQQWSADMARRIWREAVAGDAPHSLVPAYFASRGLRLEPGAPIRFHPHAWRNPKYGPHGPAMLAEMVDPVTGEWRGLHVTYLRADGTGKAEGERAKVMFGGVGAIRLAPLNGSTRLGIAEGAETTLSVAQGFGWTPVWAATSAGAIARFPVLPDVTELTLFADPDGPGLAAARKCAGRWQAAGRHARLCIPPAGIGDFNDLHRARITQPQANTPSLADLMADDLRLDPAALARGYQLHRRAA